MKMRKEYLLIMFALLCGAIYVDISLTKASEERVAKEKADKAETARVKANIAKEKADEQAAAKEAEAKEKADEQAKAEAKAAELANNGIIDNKDEAIDKVLSDVTTGGGFGPRENYQFKVDTLDDGFMVHVFPKTSKDEMGKFKVFTNGDIIAGYVTSADEAIDYTKKHIAGQDATKVNPDTDIYQFTATDGDQLGIYQVTVTLKDTEDQNELDYNALGTYTVDSQGIITEFAQDTSNRPSKKTDSKPEMFNDQACTNAVKTLKNKFDFTDNENTGYAAFKQDDGSYIIRQTELDAVANGGSGTAGIYQVKDGEASLLNNVGEIKGQQCYAGN